MNRIFKLILICFIMLINIAPYNANAISAENSYTLGEIEILLNSGNKEVYKIYKSPFVDDQDQINDTLIFIYERSDVKEILSINGVDIKDTVYEEFTGEITDKQKHSENNNEEDYKQSNSGDIIKKDNENNVIYPINERKDVEVVVNGKVVTVEDKAFIENGRTMVPFRLIAESLGADVGYNFRNENLKVIWSIRADVKVDMRVDDYRAYRNEKMVYMDVAPVLYNNKTYIPLRYITELFNCEVNWDSESYTATISTRKGR